MSEATPNVRPAGPDPGIAMVVGAAGGLAAFQIGGLAARDGLFLSQLPAEQLPAAMLLAAVISLGATLGLSQWMRFARPDRVAPLALLFSAGCFAAIGALVQVAPHIAAVLLYLQVTGIGPVVASSFWSVVNERFDPYQAKRVVARMAAAGALGGVVGGALAERLATWVGIPVLLFVLAGVCAACAFATRRIGAGSPVASEAPEGSPESGLRLLRRVPLLGQMAVLMLLVAVVETLVEYALKVEAAESFQSSESLVRFFAFFYAACGLLAFGIQSLVGDRFLRRFGLAGAVAMLPAGVALFASFGAAGAKLLTVALARGAENVASVAFFRAGFQLLYTPMATGVKRPAKVWVDVASGSVGDMLGAGLILGLLFVLPGFPTEGLMIIAVAGCIAALGVVRGVHKGYVAELTDSLQRGKVAIRAEDALDATTARTIVQSQLALDRRSLLEKVRAYDAEQSAAASRAATPERDVPPAEPGPAEARGGDGDPMPQWVATLCSGNEDRIRRALAGEIDATPGANPERRRRLVAHVIPLLGDVRLAREARDFLRPLAPRSVGQLVDALLERESELAVRARVAWILGGITDARAVEGLWSALADSEHVEFPIRVACARAIARIVARSPGLGPARERIHEQVGIELDVDPTGWQSQQARKHEALGERSVLLSRRALSSVNESLEHVFTLLAIAHERELMASALAGLSSGEGHLRGTALELLESVLPAPIRRRLWPRLDASPAPRERPRTSEQIADELLETTSGQVVDRDSL